MEAFIMKKNFKGIFTVLILIALMLAMAIPAFASEAETTDTAIETTAVAEEAQDNTIGDKAWAAAIVVGIAAAAGV